MTSLNRPKLCWIALSLILGTTLFLIRLTGPTDLESYDQGKSIGYLLDLLIQGNWLLQHDLQGKLSPLPPLYTWLTAPFAALFGLNRLTLTLPSFLSVLALGLLVLEFGRRRFGQRAGGLGMIAIMLAPTMAKQVAFVGSAPVLTLTITTMAFAAFLAWERGHEAGNTWGFFWLMAAASTLIGGVFGPILIAGGLLMSRFWPTQEAGRPLQHTSHRVGFTLFLAVILGWLGATWFNSDRILADRLLSPELRGGLFSIFGRHPSDWTIADLLSPTFYLLVRYLPFSVPLVIALWRAISHPATDAGERRFERFLACWVVCGLLLLSLGKLQSPDQLLPLWPACALLAGRELARFANRIGETRFAGIAMVLGIVLLGATYAAAHLPVPATQMAIADSALVSEFKLARDSQAAAEAFMARNLDPSGLIHIGTPTTAQLYLASYRPLIDPLQLPHMLADTKEDLNLALGSTSIERLNIDTRHRSIQRIFRWPEDETRAPIFHVYRLSYLP